MYMSMYIWPASVTGLTMANIKVCTSAEFDVTSILKRTDCHLVSVMVVTNQIQNQNLAKCINIHWIITLILENELLRGPTLFECFRHEKLPNIL